MNTATRTPTPHPAPARRRRRRRRSRALPVLICLIALALLAGTVLFVRAAASGSWPAVKSVTVDTPAAVELDDGWTAQLTALTSPKQQQSLIRDTLRQVSGWGANAVVLTGRTAGGQTLFRDSTETLTADASLTASDGLLSRFDALQYLVKQASAGGIQVFLLATDDSGSLLSAEALQSAAPAWLTAVQKAHGLTVLALSADSADTRLTSYAAADGSRTFLRCDTLPAVLAGAVENAGGAANAVLGSWTGLSADSSPAVLYACYVSGGSLPDLTQYENVSTYAETLSVAYPTQDNATVHSKSLFLMGTSDPAADLTLNGAAVARYGTHGVWGVLVTLAKGANTFALVNGSASLSYTVNYEKAAAGSYTVTPDGTPGTEAIGRKIVVTDAIASALSNCKDSSTIRETLYKGAAAAITDVVTYTSGTKSTHAYKLSTGDYVRAAACTVTDAADAAFTGASWREDAASRCTVLDFAGSGTPAVYHSWQDGTLTLTFLSASFTGELGTLPAFVQDAAVSGGDGTFTLTLHFADSSPLYGWTVNYDTAADTTSIWLKQRPQLAAGTQPLAGITVMLDAGHGGDADGAMGAAGMSAPVEKDLNLAAAYAAKYRLEQLGATVLMTRTDDANPSLGDRVTAMNEQHPDFFVAIHHNSVELTSDVNQSSGTEAYWFYDTGKPLADSLITQVCALTGRPNRGSAYGYYYVTRSDICPATLLELGFVTNPAEYESCADPDTIWAEGSAIATGIYDTVAANGTAAVSGDTAASAAAGSAAGDAGSSSGESAG